MRLEFSVSSLFSIYLPGSNPTLSSRESGQFELKNSPSEASSSAIRQGRGVLAYCPAAAAMFPSLCAAGTTFAQAR